MEYAEGKMLARIEDGIGFVTINNPEKRNAMTPEMRAGFDEILQLFESDPKVVVVVLSGAGDKAFVAGADLNHRGMDGKEVAPPPTRLSAFPKPVIAQIRGYCIGGGLTMAIQSDLRIAADNAVFVTPPAKLGRASSFGNVERLTALVGHGHARMMFFTGANVSAAEAERIGLVNLVVPGAELEQTVREIARKIAANAPLSLAALKLTINEAAKDPEQRDLAKVEQAIVFCHDSADFREGRKAFLEKRKPVFQGV